MNEHLHIKGAAAAYITHQQHTSGYLDHGVAGCCWGHGIHFIMGGGGGPLL